ncbi:MAG TPA: 4'-phosphopantetheinyl transferase superfamily protein [Candidatus Angelobacter sp.]|nr:4'-phosphopantetheinyl transferase superfamily protein [Candidatus Angelobacter sp.]
MQSFPLPPQHVDIWKIDLRNAEAVTLADPGLLSPDEADRAARFRFARDRQRFIAGRIAMRRILAGYANVSPREVVFSYGTDGKPELSGALQQCGLKFNLSHSRDLGLLAVTKCLNVGIDVEWIDDKFPTQEIAQQFYSAAEIRRFQELDSLSRVAGFYECWTRKEAYIKALGGGLAVPLDSFEVAFGKGAAAALLQVRSDPRELMRWSMYGLNVEFGYKAALVVEGRGHRLRRLSWTPDVEKDSGSEHPRAVQQAFTLK